MITSSPKCNVHQKGYSFSIIFYRSCWFSFIYLAPPSLCARNDHCSAKHLKIEGSHGSFRSTHPLMSPICCPDVRYMWAVLQPRCNQLESKPKSVLLTLELTWSKHDQVKFPSMWWVQIIIFFNNPLPSQLHPTR